VIRTLCIRTVVFVLVSVPAFVLMAMPVYAGTSWSR
jgi:hypothetical protein